MEDTTSTPRGTRSANGAGQGPHAVAGADPMLSIPEVASYLRVSIDTVRRLICDRSIAASKVRAIWRVRRSAVDAYVLRNTRGAA